MMDRDEEDGAPAGSLPISLPRASPPGNCLSLSAKFPGPPRPSVRQRVETVGAIFATFWGDVRIQKWLLVGGKSAPLQFLLLKLLLLVERSEREALLSSTRNPSMRRTPGSQMMENRLGWQGLPGKFWMRDGNLAGN